MHTLIALARRELRRLRGHPVLWCLLGPIPFAMTVLLTGVFAGEVVHDLPVAMLDLDRSTTSRVAARWLEATRGVKVTRHVDDMGAAQSAVLERQVYGVLVVPHHFQRDLLRGKSPHITFIYNEEYLTAGGNLSAEVARGAGTAAAVLTTLSGNEPSAVRLDLRNLFNPTASYAVSLGFVLIAALLQVVIGLSTIYAVGREISDGTTAEWLEAARGSTFVACVGKLAPYTVLHCVSLLVLLGGYASWYQIPVRGPVWLLVISALAFVVASQSIGILIIARTANLAKAVGPGALIFGPAAAFSGVTFPLAAMPLGARMWAETIPLTHFMVLVRAAITVGSPESAPAPLLALLLTTVVALGLAYRRLPVLLRNPVHAGES